MATQSFRGNLAGLPLTSTGDLTVTSESGDVVVKLGDTSGNSKLRILDATNTEVATINSDGVVTATEVVISGSTVMQIVEDIVLQLAIERKYVLLDKVNHAVTGQARTYYIDKDATTYGYNVDANPHTGLYDIRIVLNGQELLQGVDYEIVRSQSTGPEGSSAVGSLNAIEFQEVDIELGDTIWYSYIRESEATT